MTKILDFAAICNRKGFSERTHLLLREPTVRENETI